RETTARRERRAFHGPHCPWPRRPRPYNPLSTPRFSLPRREPVARALLGENVGPDNANSRANWGSAAVILLQVNRDDLGVGVADGSAERVDHLADLRVP